MPPPTSMVTGGHDLFLSGPNRLFAGVDSSVFTCETFGDEDLVAGVARWNLDRDIRLIGFQEVVASVGYTAAVETVAHFGIGARNSVELRVEMADGNVHTSSVEANSVVTIDS